MKKKIKDLKNYEMNTICSKHINKKCEECPLRRFDSKTGREKLYCFKQARALMYSNITFYKNFEGMTEERKQFYIEREQQEEQELEDVEIEL